MTGRKLFILGAVLVAVAVACFFGSLWWWALRGIHPDVWLAWNLTAIAAGSAGGFCISEAGHR